MARELDGVVCAPARPAFGDLTNEAIAQWLQVPSIPALLTRPLPCSCEALFG
jgi:hypothetical protein